MSERKRKIMETLDKALDKAGPQATEYVAGFCEGMAVMAGNIPGSQQSKAPA